MKNKLLLPAFALVLVASAVLGMSQVRAQSQQSQYPSMIQKLVERFGFKESDVQDKDSGKCGNKKEVSLGHGKTALISNTSLVGHETGTFYFFRVTV